MPEKQKSPLSRLLDFAGAYRSLTFVGLFLSAVAQICGMVPYLCVYLVLKDLILAAPHFSDATSIARYG
ncbi:MAG: ABC transporter ATP-binding protein, partial [Treponema sp.]|nr:ABC transporter ATP-binding protein [Treponema sp.]